MKKIITLMIMALLFTLKAIASVDIPTEYYSTVGEGTFAFYDVENKQFITSGVNADTPEFLTLTQDVDDKYFCQFENGSYWRFSYTWEYPRLFKDATEETRTSFAFEGNYAEGYLIATGNDHYYGQDVGGDWGQTTAVAERMHHVALISRSDYNSFVNPYSSYYSAVGAGVFALYDVTEKKFIGVNSDQYWRSSVFEDTPTYYTLVESEGKYTIQTAVGYMYTKEDHPGVWMNGDDNAWSAGWFNTWTFENTDQSNTYYINLKSATYRV